MENSAASRSGMFEFRTSENGHNISYVKTRGHQKVSRVSGGICEGKRPVQLLREHRPVLRTSLAVFHTDTRTAPKIKEKSRRIEEN